MPIEFDKWFLPSRTSNGGTCVETKITPDAVFVRNDHLPDAGTAEFTHEEWKVFVVCVKEGQYDI